MRPSTERVRALVRARGIELRTAAIGLGVVTFGVLEGRALLHSLNDPIPNVVDAVTSHLDPIEPWRASSGRTVIVLLDGVGERPLLAEAARLGPPTLTLQVDTGEPSLSRPGYHALLTGLPQWASGVRSNFDASGRADSVAHRVRVGGGRVAWLLEGVQWFDELFGKPGDVVVRGAPAFELDAFERAYRDGASLIVVHLVQSDAMGHAHGAASDEYRRVVAAQIDHVAAIQRFLASEPDGARVRLFLGADHGHLPNGGHGGPEADVREIAWLMFGPPLGPQPRHPTGRVPMGAMAPLLAASLGVPAPRAAIEASPLAERAPESVVARREAAEAARLASADQVRRLRTGNAGTAGVVLAIAGFALGARRLAASSLPTLTAALGFVLLGPGLTLSAIRLHGVFVARALLAVTLGASVSWPWAKRFGATPGLSFALSVVPSLAALAWTLGSLGVTDPGPHESLLLPSTGLLPAGVVLGVVLVTSLSRWWATKRSTSRQSPTSSSLRPSSSLGIDA